MGMKNKGKRIVLFITCIILYTIGLILLCRCVGIDSDKANHLLQAEDILKGNVFLKDWNLTGVTFLTTDMLFYEIAVAICGIGYKSICVANGLMIASVIIASVILSFVGKTENNVIRATFWALLLSIPCEKLITQFRVHTGAVFLCFLCFLLCYFVLEKKRTEKKWLILLGILLFAGMFGDLLTFVYGVVPIILLAFTNTIRRANEIRKTSILMIAICIASTMISLLVEKLYFLIGGANPNSYIGERQFTPVSLWGERILEFINICLSFSLADFSEKQMSDVWAIVCGANAIIFFLAIAFVINILIKIVKGADVDTISTLLSLCVLMSFLAFVLTDMSYPRYITVVPIAAMIVLVRNTEWIYGYVREEKEKKIVTVAILLIAAIGFSGKIHEIIKYEYPDSNINSHELISFLEENNLEYGYASFWNASNNTVLSKEKVKIRHIIKSGEEYVMHNWFNKNCWYEEPAKFVLINNDEEIFGVDERSVIAYFGEPVTKREIKNYTVLIYDKELSKELGHKGNAIDDNHIAIDEVNTNEYSERSENRIILHNEGMIFGPYDAISEGEYNITIWGENLKLATFDIWSESHGCDDAYYSYEELSRDNNSIEIKLTVRKPLEDIEFRLFNPSLVDVEFEAVIIGDKES